MCSTFFQNHYKYINASPLYFIEATQKNFDKVSYFFFYKVVKHFIVNQTSKRIVVIYIK